MTAADPRSVLVTGASGFLGAAVAGLLQRNGATVTATGRRAEGGPAGIRYAAADLGDPAAADAFPGPFGTVVHCAGLAHRFGDTPAAEFFRVNVGATRTACRIAAAAGAERFVLVSSVAVYGGAEPGREVDESAECDPRDPYAKSKLEAEREAAGILEGTGIRLLVLRPSTIAGPGDRGNISRLIAQIARGRFLWLGDGSNRKSLIALGDAASIIAGLALRPEFPRGVYNLTGRAVTVREIVGTIAAAAGRRIPRFALPAGPILAGVRLNRRTLGLGRIESLGRTVEKWLGDDVFSGGKLAAELGIIAATDPLAAVRDQARAQLSSI